jgi:hypothetical protein
MSPADASAHAEDRQQSAMSDGMTPLASRVSTTRNGRIGYVFYSHGDST